MAIYPTPTGADTTAPAGVITAAQYAANFDAHYPGKNAGAAFLAYAAAHPSDTAQQAAQAFTTMIAVEGLDKAVAAALAGSAQLLGAAAKISGLNPFQGWLTGFLSVLTSAHTWERVLEVGLGIVLIALGVAKLTHAVPVATQIASKVP